MNRAHHSSRSWLRYSSFYLSLLLILTLVAPPALAGQVVFQALAKPENVGDNVVNTIVGWLRSNRRSQEPLSRGVRPPRPHTRSEKESRLARLEINPSGNLFLQSHQPMWFTAIPFDSEGAAIHGLHAEWESSDRQVVFIKKTGQAVAGKPGSAILTSRAGSLSATVRVTVTAANGQRFGGKKTQDSSRGNRRASQESKQVKRLNLLARNRKRHHAVEPATTSPPVPMRDPYDDPLPDTETSSLYQPANAIGSPPGKRRAGAPMAGSALETTESGNKNFSFALPLAGLPGRGLDVSLSLVYNSNVWNKPNDGYSTWMTYDVDSSWPATGWRITLGQIEDQGSYGFTLTDMDGTRRPGLQQRLQLSHH